MCMAHITNDADDAALFPTYIKKQKNINRTCLPIICKEIFHMGHQAILKI